MVKFAGLSLVVVLSVGNAFARNPVPGPLALRAPASGSTSHGSSQEPSHFVVHSKIYAAGSDRTQPLFEMVREEKTEGDRTLISEVFTDPQGIEAFRSETTLQGGRFVRYDLQQKQLHDTAKIEAKDGHIYFEYVDHDGKVKKDEEKWNDDFVVGAILSRHVKAHWADLVAGKNIDMRFGVPERRETVGFKIFKEEEKKIDGRDVIVAKMKPTSMIIAAIVKPLYFYFDKETKRLVEFRGRVLPKQKDGNGWKDLDAETVYSYK